MSNEPYKWQLNPKACLKELGRMEDDPGYTKTICGIHRILWAYLNVDCAGYLPEEAQEKINELLEVAFKYGKRMDYRLKQYHALAAGLDLSPEEVLDYKPGDERSEQLQSEVYLPNYQVKGNKRREKP